MHEMTLVHSLLSVAEQHARERRATGIRRLTCTIGCLRAIDSQLLNESFAIARADSLARDADLEVRPSKIELICAKCGHRGRVDHLRFDCPMCFSSDIELSGGDELELTSLELELPDAD